MYSSYFGTENIVKYVKNSSSIKNLNVEYFLYVLSNNKNTNFLSS